jgi:ligand-binding sensor domain-containing protein
MEDINGNLWIATCEKKMKNYELQKFDGKNWEVIKDCPVEKPSVLFADSKNNIWVSPGIAVTDDKCVARFDGKKWSTFSANEGLNDYWVYKFFEDKDQNIWMLTYLKGAIKYNGTSFTTIVDRLSATSCIMEDHDGNIWIGGKILNKYDGTKATPTQYKGVCSLTLSQDNTIWFGKLAGRVGKFDGTNNSMTKLGGCYYGNTAMASAFILGILPGFIVGFVHFPVDHFTTIFCDSKNDIWVGARGGGGGLFKKEGENDWENYKKSFKNAKKITTIAEDPQGNLWLSTRKKTIIRFDGTTWVTYTGKEVEGLKKSNLDKSSNIRGLPITSCLVDDRGNVWFTTMNGLIEYNSSAAISEK